MTAITLIGLMAVAVWQIIVAAGWRERGKVAGLALLAPLIAFGLTARQLLPALEMTRYSLRAGLAYEEATAYSLPPAALASTFSALLFGRGAAEFWGPWERVETMYVGVVPLLLAGLAFRRKWRDVAPTRGHKRHPRPKSGQVSIVSVSEACGRLPAHPARSS